MSNLIKAIRDVTIFILIAWISLVFADYISFAIFYNSDCIPHAIVMLVTPVVYIFYHFIVLSKRNILGKTSIIDLLIKWAVLVVEAGITWGLMTAWLSSDYWLTTEYMEGWDALGVFFIIFLYAVELALCPILVLIIKGVLKLKDLIMSKYEISIEK